MSAPYHRIVIRGVNWLGDAVMTTPALIRLREGFPEAHISLATRAKLAGLWQSHPAVNSVIEIAPGEGVFSVAKKMRETTPDLALILPNSPRSALEAWLAGIPERVGYRRGWRGCLLTRAVPARAGHVRMRKRRAAEVRRLISGSATGPRPQRPPGPEAHQVHEYLHLIGSVGASTQPTAPVLNVLEDEVNAVAARFGLSRVHRWFGLNAGAEYGPAKRWPAERFIQVACAVQQKFPEARWVVVGGPADAALAGEISAGLTRALGSVFPGFDPNRLPVNVAGQTSLRELLAVLKLSCAVLTNDTGPMHLAAAVGTPVVVPFGSTSPELTGPGLPGDPRHRLIRSNVPCAPCFLRECPIDFRCMENISVAQVSTALIGAVENR